MNLKGKTLDQWLQKAKANEFPGNNRDDYFTRYKDWSTHLYNHVHNQVNAGAQISDGGYLTDHGADHVRTVIQRASELVAGDECHLTGYEVYLLLGAMHIHDVGNIYGREEHEIKGGKILEYLGMLIGSDDIEKRTISDIAQAHGGWPKNKIDAIPKSTAILGRTPRMQLLAAILKFADELADDHSRAARFLTLDNLLPPESEVFHHFALALHSVVIDVREQHQVDLSFQLNRKQITEPLGKKKIGAGAHDVEKVFLIDEILKRTWKTHLERIYCMRFMTPQVRIDRINVTIEFYEGVNLLCDPIGYRLEELGYPDYRYEKIYDLCPELRLSRNRKLTGKYLKGRIERKQRK